jgi:flagellar hook-basal body complex protein FliE
MIDGVTNNLSLGKVPGGGATPGQPAAGAAGASPFADVLKGSIDEVAKLQEDASSAVQKLALGESEDFAGIMNAVEKSDIAFKTLLAIRAKLMDAYEEIKNIQV